MQAPAAAFDGHIYGTMFDAEDALHLLSRLGLLIGEGLPKFLLNRRQFAFGGAAAATIALIPKGNALPINALAQAATATSQPLDPQSPLS